ncbi:MAG: hypothetical protein M1389_02760 [Chloroflexi bacterium]|nr:hypothetical protein [Chloroflexota bacterium]
MQQSIKAPVPAAEPNLAEEMGKIPYEPLLPVEKKMIAWSIGLGVTLLVVLVVVSNLFFR